MLQQLVLPVEHTTRVWKHSAYENEGTECSEQFLDIILYNKICAGHLLLLGLWNLG
jgi:hypothetical protein